MNLQNNTILITGGSSGIGLELARTFLKKENTVIVLGRNRKKLQQLKKEGFKTIVCDIGNQQDTENAVLEIQQNYAELNILFNNAGVQFNYLYTDTIIPLDKISKEININLTGQIVLTQMLLPILVTKEKAYIINTTSGLGAFPKNDGIVYSASKAGMRNFTVGLRYAMRNTGVKVFEFIPPVTDTEMTKGRDEIKTKPKELIDQILPQLAKEKRILSVRKIRVFLWISFLFPNLAYKIISK